MKQGHLAILYMVVYVFCFVSLLTVQTKYDVISEERRNVEACLKKATEEAKKE